jgi:Plasmid pRiA4b ORF-3-like protein
MATLSPILLAAMGWNNSHLHAFLIGAKRIGMCFDDYPEDEIDEKESLSSRLFARNDASSLNTTSATAGSTTWSSRT